MNFVLHEMTFLRYFIPLIIEGNRRGVKSKMYVYWTSNKYSSTIKNQKQLLEFSDKYNFQILDLGDWNSDGDTNLTFFIEGVGTFDGIIIKRNSIDQLFVSITYMADYQNTYENYINICDYILFPSKFFAEEFNTLSEKNLYLGSPKYDVEMNSLPRDKKRVLIIHPGPVHASENLKVVHNIFHLSPGSIFQY